MSSTPINACVIGTGSMGAQHAKAWCAAQGARLVALADPQIERARALADECGVERAVADYRELVTADEIDVVSVCTPAGFHPEVAVLAAEHGKHVLCEKPIALTLEDADRMIRAASERGVLLGVGFQLRYSRTTAELAALVQAGEIGRPVMWRRHVSAPIRTVVGKPAMHDLKHGNGGPVVDFCPHTFDRWRQVLDSEPVRVTARGMTLAKDRPELAEIEEVAPDTAAITVEHASGDLGVFTICWGLPPGAKAGAVEDIVGPKGGVVLEGNRIIVTTEGGAQRELDCPGAADKKPEIAGFVRAIEGQGEPAAVGEDGRAALRVSLAALESLRTAEAVSLD